MRAGKLTIAQGFCRPTSILCLAFVLLAGPALAKSSLGIGTADTMTPAGGSGLFGPLFTQITLWQREFFSAVREALVGLKREEGAFALLVGLSFSYGVFHAAGPGHGKAVISAYMLASRAELKRGIFLSFVSSLVQGTTAILAVGAGWYLLRGSGVSMSDATDMLEIASYALVTTFGLALLVRALVRLSRVAGLRHRLSAAGTRISRMVRKGAGGGSSGAMGALAFAAPSERSAGYGFRAEALERGATCEADEADCGCGRAHMPAPEAVSRPLTLRSGLAAVMAIGLRPCAGAVVVLTFALLNELYLGGLLSVFAMSLGTAITVSALASLTVLGRGALERFGGQGRGQRRFSLLSPLLQLAGALLMTLVGVGLLGAALTA
ncbi:MAG: nickel/cobalt transporter [Pseudomonadota bacterium]|nr:nickel/cobalt transporter [Pseudomonadota bacterium]